MNHSTRTVDTFYGNDAAPDSESAVRGASRPHCTAHSSVSHEVMWQTHDEENHRADGPASMWLYGGVMSRMCWWINGRVHRPDGPCDIATNGHLRWVTTIGVDAVVRVSAFGEAVQR